MDNLGFLQANGLLDHEGFPIVPVEPVKVVKSGVIFQQLCRNGLPYDIAVSWLQKAIRRGLFEQALYCAYHIADLGKIFRSHLLNRLAIICSEDIGPAEPGLPTIIEELYFKTQNEWNGAAVIQMIWLLCRARKSRITDWSAHVADPDLEWIEPDGYAFDSAKDLVDWCVHLCKTRTKSDERITVQYTYKGTTMKTKKQSAIYHIWNMMLAASDDVSIIYRDVVALLRLFDLRGPEYGLLFVVHAATLMFMSNEPALLNVPDLPTWDQIGEWAFPVMNHAVDMHTGWGRRLLGRSMIDFLYEGARLENWTPMGNELQLLKQIQDELNPPETEDSQPRGYQQLIVHETVNFLRTNGRGWLSMACGTGKTKTAYWIMKDFVQSSEAHMLIVVVTPFLQILRQFHKTWSAMNRMHQIRSITGILASCSDVYAKDEYSNYEYLSSDADIKRFLDYPDRVKIIHTTYSSLQKLLEAEIRPTLVIYDEAHHIKEYHLFSEQCMKLFLTATPKKDYANFGDVIASYNLRNAISDGHLTPYEVGVFQNDEAVEALMYVQEKARKTIVYCSTNAIAKEFHSQWIDSVGDNGNAFYVDCKTSKKERDRIFHEYSTLPKAVIFNCAILAEGVDFTVCDSILIHSGYVSETRMVQAMGRPLRLNPGKELAQIYIMDDGRVEKRLAVMSIYDPEVYEHTKYIY